MASGAATVFISYARADEAVAARCATRLRSAGFNAWRDADCIRLREAHESAISGALDRAAAVVVLVSARSAARPWVRSEVAYARSLGVRVIALRLDRSPVPDWAGPWTSVDAWSPDATAQLVAAVERADRRRRA